MAFYTFFMGDRSIENFIWSCDSNGHGGIMFVDMTDSEQQRRLCKLKTEIYHQEVRFSDIYLNKIAWAKTKEEWIHRYMKYVPFKVDENGVILNEPIISVMELEEPFMLTIDDYRRDYVDIYAYDEEHKDKFEKHKKVWLEAKAYAYRMADIIFKNLEEV